MQKSVKRRILLNTIMVLAIAAIAAAGVLTVGGIRGWFGAAPTVQVAADSGSVENVAVTVQNKIGSVSIQRDGIAYTLQEHNALRDGDTIETRNSSSIDIVFGQNTISLDENSRVRLWLNDGHLALSLENGGVFAVASDPLTLQVMDTEVSLSGGVLSASAPYGSANVHVFEREADVGSQTVAAGQAVSMLSDGIHPSELTLQSLNDFDLAHIVKANQQRSLCFTNEQVDQLADMREQARQEALQARLLEQESEQRIEAQRQQNEQNLREIAEGERQPVDGNTPLPGNDDPGQQPTQTGLTCTITIRCDTILDNMDALTDGKNKYVPANGCILATSKIHFEEGETVFDVLKRACSLADLQLEYSWTPMYNSYYIEGINHLYEFDCGNESGWMYKVNEWFPNYGCSSYTLKDGDAIVWCFTCNGLGADVGGSVY